MKKLGIRTKFGEFFLNLRLHMKARYENKPNKQIFKAFVVFLELLNFPRFPEINRCIHALMEVFNQVAC